MGRSLIEKGLRRLLYAMALSNGNPSEKNEIKKSLKSTISSSAIKTTIDWHLADAVKWQIE